jgi:phosphoglycerate dehydrogenase-like enzyme
MTPGALSRFLPIRRFMATKAVTEIKTVGMVGLGLMGHGIAQMAANSGYKVSKLCPLV